MVEPRRRLCDKIECMCTLCRAEILKPLFRTCRKSTPARRIRTVPPEIRFLTTKLDLSAQKYFYAAISTNADIVVYIICCVLRAGKQNNNEIAESMLLIFAVEFVLRDTLFLCFIASVFTTAAVPNCCQQPSDLQS
jgi:hypothetical protein